ncbi:hypothetical protein [Natrarchaeobaculum sulfurireducens]|uniref:hypothetical protein n=1 Tax=Natrarchaeobaculum sulfurireducens TaxID=2044521 RepID=UPI000E3E0462|nr:hypothetical protein [Natrarchaeobaculum sulfurireducens]
MSTFERRVSLGLGVVLLVVFAWSLWNSLEVLAADPTSSTAVALVLAGIAVLLGALAFVAAGLRERLPVAGRSLEWWQLQGVGFAALGGYMVISGLAQGVPASVYDGSTLAAGVAFVAVGYIRFRDGVPEETEPTGRQAAIIVVGTLAALLVLAVLMIWTI